jgi:hypothetical protein
MPALSLFQEPVLLDRKEHMSLRLKKAFDLDFAKDINSVPLAGFEFFETSRDFPVVFAKSGDSEFIPLVLLSLRSKSHMLGPDWKGVYIPAAIRRYPFALTDGKVLFDKRAPELQEKEGEALFKENGENSDFLNRIIEFLGHVEHQFKHTRDYCKACVEHDLLTPFKAQVEFEKGKRMRFDNFSVIDVKKLNQLPEGQVKDWFYKGWLAWSYAHLHSLGAMSRLIRRERQADMASESHPAEA